VNIAFSDRFYWKAPSGAFFMRGENLTLTEELGA
jgi:hypothetical protein